MSSTAFALMAAVVVGACGPSPSAVVSPPTSLTATNPAPLSSGPTATSTPTPVPSPSPSPTATRTPLAFPDLSEVALAPGRYDSSPPFDLDFTFELFDEGWQSAHLNSEFFDVIKVDPADPSVPVRWVAWGHPETVHGASSEPADSLAPQEAANLIATNDNLEAESATPFEFAGLDGVMLDLHAGVSNTPIFGGPGGNFGLEPSHDLRLGIVKVESEMLLVLCLAAPAELDEACAEVQPILDSVEF